MPLAIQQSLENLHHLSALPAFATKSAWIRLLVEKKPIRGWAESSGNSKTPDITFHAAVVIWLLSLTPVISLSMLTGGGNQLPLACSGAKFKSVFNIRLNAVVRLKLYRVRGRTHAVIFFATQRNIRPIASSREHAACFQELAVEVQRVQRFFQKSHTCGISFTLLPAAGRLVLSMASPG